MAAHRALLIALPLLFSLAFLSPPCAAARPLPPPSSDSSDQTHPLFNIVPIAVGIVVFLAVRFCLLLISSLLFPCLIRLYRRNRRQPYSVSGDVAASFDDVDVWERPGMSAKQMEKIPERLHSAEVKEVLAGKGAAECAVCLCEFEDHDRLRLLPAAATPSTGTASTLGWLPTSHAPPAVPTSLPLSRPPLRTRKAAPPLGTATKWW